MANDISASVLTRLKQLVSRRPSPAKAAPFNQGSTRGVFSDSAMRKSDFVTELNSWEVANLPEKGGLSEHDLIEEHASLFPEEFDAKNALSYLRKIKPDLDQVHHFGLPPHEAKKSGQANKLRREIAKVFMASLDEPSNPENRAFQALMLANKTFFNPKDKQIQKIATKAVEQGNIYPLIFINRIKGLSLGDGLSQKPKAKFKQKLIASAQKLGHTKIADYIKNPRVSTRKLHN